MDEYVAARLPSADGMRGGGMRRVEAPPPRPAGRRGRRTGHESIRSRGGGRRAGRRGGGARGRQGRAARRDNRGDRLGRRAVHATGGAAGRAPVDRDAWRHAVVSRPAYRRSRLLPPALPAHR